MSSQKYSDEDLRRVTAIKDELVDERLDVVLKVVSGIQVSVGDLEEDVAELKSDMKVVKPAVTDTSRQVHDLDQYVTHLENA
ncbi:MAG: hypothetical protein ACREGF_01255 [Candidatus Saccharimonadales bacterium]